MKIKILSFTLLLQCSVFATTLNISEISGLNLISGKTTSIKNKNRPTVAFFLNRSCPCSQAHFDHLNNLSKEYPQYNFVGLHSNKTLSEKSAQEYFQQFKIDFPVIQDKSLKYANIFSALKTPHTFILNTKNEIIYQGGATNSRDPKRATKFYLEDALSEMAQGKQISTPVTKTLGCYIQR